MSSSVTSARMRACGSSSDIVGRRALAHSPILPIPFALAISTRVIPIHSIKSIMVPLFLVPKALAIRSENIVVFIRGQSSEDGHPTIIFTLPEQSTLHNTRDPPPRRSGRDLQEVPRNRRDIERG